MHKVERVGVVPWLEDVLYLELAVWSHPGLSWRREIDSVNDGFATRQQFSLRAETSR